MSLAALMVLSAAEPAAPTVDLLASLLPSPVKAVADGTVAITGRAEVTDGTMVRIRVTTAAGQVCENRTPASARRFSCRFPQDFPGAPALAPMVLVVDASEGPEDGADMHRQAEALLIVAGPPEGPSPDLPLVFTDDLIDDQGRTDAASAQFPRDRVLVNRFMRSRAAGLMGMRRMDFDLARPADLAWFKENASLYEFDHRDRDWSTPLGNRVARGFWQAMWNRWFNASNDHPWDGNPANRDQANYRPYTFANDPADLVILYAMARRSQPVVADNRIALSREVLRNIIAMQHRGAGNFALVEASGKCEHYTAGAFRYGMFETGEWLTEGTGWFANPQFRDFAWGGVLNGRCCWALGEMLRAEPDGPLAAAIREAIPLTLRFCLHDALEHGYARRMADGRPSWGYPGEHGYLTLGMLAACAVRPDLPVALETIRPLREVVHDALDVLVEAADGDGGWTHYSNVNAVNILALAEGACTFAGTPAAGRWRQAAMRAADLWLGLRPRAAEPRAPTPLFGHRKDGGMTWFLGKEKLAHQALYANGHWLHALAALHAVTGERRYRDRATAILAYYCGANPLQVRLLNEMGAVNNRVTDSDGDGIDDHLGWNAYPESTAFVQMGLLRLLQR